MAPGPLEPEAWGIDPGYHDALGSWRVVPEETVAAVLTSMTRDRDRYGDGGPDPSPPPVVTIRLDHPVPPVDAGVLTLEDGTELRMEGHLPPDVPPGYHLVHPDGARPPYVLVVSPGRCPHQGRRQWGWATQLFASRSEQSWGMGDLADLRRIGKWSASLGAGAVLVNPLHAPPPGPRQEPSPYYAGSRCFDNPLYLRVEEIPGAAQLPGLGELASAGRTLNLDRLIDRDRVWALKAIALHALFDGFDGDDEFERYQAERGSALAGYATFSALADVHGPQWRAWPVSLRHPDGAAVARFASSRYGQTRIRWHSWLQWHTDRQLRAAAQDVTLVRDLAIGVGGGGADAWLYQDAFAQGMSIGAPPDEFNTLGQKWGLLPWDPWRLRRLGYLPFVETLRGGLRHSGGLRFDHVMGLFRMFWIPEMASPGDGAYVRYPYWDLLNILSLEAHRAGAFVAGEDLGTVEDRVRAELSGRDVLSYRLFWFEEGPPPGWPDRALGAVTTHDLPTIAGVWSGSDLQAQEDLGLQPNRPASLALRARLADPSGSNDAPPVEDVIVRTYEYLGEAPCDLLVASLDDAAAVEERPNMPGTTDQWPNWRLALPVPLETLERSQLAARIAQGLRRREGPT